MSRTASDCRPSATSPVNPGGDRGLLCTIGGVDHVVWWRCWVGGEIRVLVAPADDPRNARKRWVPDHRVCDLRDPAGDRS